MLQKIVLSLTLIISITSADTRYYYPQQDNCSYHKVTSEMVELRRQMKSLKSQVIEFKKEIKAYKINNVNTHQPPITAKQEKKKAEAIAELKSQLKASRH